MEEENKSEETKENVLIKTKSEVERIIKQITENGLQTANVELLYKLIDIHKDIENEKYWKEKEEESMYRGRDYFMDDSYNGGRSRDSRGRYMDGSYGRRGVPGTGRGRYRGYDMIEEMGEHYGDYSEGRDTYGNDRETEKSFDKMLQSLEDFTYLIMQEADSQDKIEKVRKTARKISEF
nr:MAG TPA: hypothetical protein [Caudoviricetes sp.]